MYSGKQIRRVDRNGINKTRITNNEDELGWAVGGYPRQPFGILRNAQ